MDGHPEPMEEGRATLTTLSCGGVVFARVRLRSSLEKWEAAALWMRADLVCTNSCVQYIPREVRVLFGTWVGFVDRTFGKIRVAIKWV